jgi:deoxyribose-phosphate aldolase
LTGLPPSGIASRIDHTLLGTGATGSDIRLLCREAVQWGFRSVCVNPSWVRLASGLLAGEYPFACSVAGFPLGATTVKPAEAARAVEDGAGEIDMVMCVGLFLSGDSGAVETDIREVVQACAPVPVKVILETCLLTDRQKTEACSIAENAGAAWVKTSTGFGTGGATVHDVRLLRGSVGSSVGVKASGGIRTGAQALAMLNAGAGRLGCSRSVDIVMELEGERSPL